MSRVRERGPEIGLTGARFGGAARRRALLAAALPVGGDDAAEAGAPALVGGSGLRSELGVTSEPDPARATDPGPAAVPQPRRPHPRAVAADLPAPDAARNGPLSSAVRPYVLTRGRTRPEWELSVETLVSVAPAAGSPELAEHRSVMALCGRPRSVAEVAALLDVPLGVARVLVGDLAVSGAVLVHRTAGPSGPDLALLERVLGGLRRM
jgi:hypothetical protein